MKTTVFTLMTAFVLSTTTCLAQPGGRNHYQNNGSHQQYTERNMNRGDQPGMSQNHGRGGHSDDMYGVTSHRGHQPHGRTHGGRVVPVPPAPAPAPRVVERVVYPAPCAPVPPPPAPVPHHHTVHVAPAGVVAGAVIGTVIGALLCQ